MVLLTACQEQVFDTRVLEPGSYLHELPEDKVQLLAVTSKASMVVLDGKLSIEQPETVWYRSMPTIPDGGAFEITTQDCGVLRFLRLNGRSVCLNCTRLAVNTQTLKNCPISHNPPSIWQALPPQ